MEHFSVDHDGGAVAHELATEDAINLCTQLPRFEKMVVLTNLDGRERRLSQVRAITKARRLRQKYFGSDIFADPTWDILLDLYAAHLGQQHIAVTSLCLGSGVSSTTALRRLKLIENLGLTVRRPDPLDARRIYLELSHSGAARMDMLFEAIGDVHPV